MSHFNSKPNPNAPAGERAAELTRRLEALGRKDFEVAQVVLDALKDEIDQCSAVIPTAGEKTSKD